MNDTLKMYGSIGSDIMNRYFVVAMCFKRQQRWRSIVNDQFRRSTFKECVLWLKSEKFDLYSNSP